MDPQESGKASGRERPSVYDWVGDIVLLTYVGGPEFSDLRGDAFSIAKSPVEAKLGIFLLAEVNELGVMVQKAERGEEQKLSFDTPFFVPWGAVQTLEILLVAEEDE